jgi:ribonucleoside-diphosphate reductase alpha chain
MSISIAQKIKGVSVVQPDDRKPTATALQPAERSPDRRVRIKPTNGELQKLVRWTGRPNTPNGAPSMTYRVNHPVTPFGVTVAHYANGRDHPFEVTTGYADKPRGLDATAKLLSVAMRMRDPKWVARLLGSLKKTEAQAFEFAAPPTGNLVRVPSATAALAMIVEHRCEELGYFDNLGELESPMIAALIVDSEPRTGGEWSPAPHIDVENPATGDKFKLFVAEVTTEAGDILPCSVWFSGNYPKEFDGLAKLLSYAMRISDLWWLDLCLSKLDGFREESAGEFWAPVPGHPEKRACYVSTIDYVAKLLRSRYQLLGLFDEEGRAVRQRPLFLVESDTSRAAVEQTQSRKQPVCPSCHEHSLVLMDGCWTCTSPGCNHQKCG